MDGNAGLARRLHERCLLRGSFTLRSGRVSDVYFDKYLFEADPALLRDVASAMAPLVPGGVDALAGLELGGIPLVTMLSQVTGLPARFVRKEAKAYGTARLAEGGEVDGLRLAVVEDVVTSGGQVIASCRDLAGRGAEVAAVVCVVDRQQGGPAALADAGLPLRALFTMTDLEAAAA
ncbi:MAG TPA: orotate phosphoribosyltransferase [Acidimicrobiales bacterium]|jgi:orotate phosphoribosyltransferase